MKKKFIVFMLTVIMTLSLAMTANASKSNWDIVTGFGTSTGTGAGLSEEDGGLVLNGYGKLQYKPKTIKEAVAIEFKVQAYPSVSHYYYFGLLDTPNINWDTSGTKGQGIMSYVDVSADGKKMTMYSANIVKTGVMNYDKIPSSMKALDISHMVVIYREASNWVLALDGEITARVPVTLANLENIAYFVAGNSGSSTMEMKIVDVYVDSQVTQEMKDGTYIKDLAGDDSSIGVYYDEDGRLIMGEAVKVGALSQGAPDYVVSEKDASAEMNWTPVFLGASVLTLLLSLLMILSEMKKKKKRAQEVE